MDQLRPQLAGADDDGQVEFLYALSLERRGRVREALQRLEALIKSGRSWAMMAYYKVRLLRLGVAKRDRRDQALMQFRHAEALNLLCQNDMRDNDPDPRERGGRWRERALTWCDDVLGCFNTASSIAIAFGASQLEQRFQLFQRALYHSRSAYPAVMCGEELAYEAILKRVSIDQWAQLGRTVVQAGMLKDDDHPQLHVLKGVFAEGPAQARAAFRRALELNPGAVLPVGLDRLLEHRFGSERGRELADMFQPLPAAEEGSR